MGMALPILLRRLRNDLSALDANISVSGLTDDLKVPFVLEIHVADVPGYRSPDVLSEEHSFSLMIGENFPYERPKVRWLTEIFHPNIMPPSEGGIVCVMGIDHWDFNTSLGVFINDLTDLIKNPNPDNPLNSETCSAAAEWFKNRVE